MRTAFSRAVAACDTGDFEDDRFVGLIKRVLHGRQRGGAGSLSRKNGDGVIGQRVIRATASGGARRG